MRVKTIAMGWVLVGLSGAGNFAAATTTINEPARDTTAELLQGIPPAEQASSASAYRYVRHCLARRQFESFLRSDGIDPDATSSLRVRAAGMQEPLRTRFLENVRMLDARRAACAPWEQSVAPDKGALQVYLLALDNAAAGDARAAACFVALPWAEPAQGTPDHARFAGAYTAQARTLIDAGIARGSWLMVRAAAGRLNAHPHVTMTLPIEPALAYRISRLMQMGIEDPALSGTFAADARRYASSLSPAVLEVLEKDVQSQFSSVFAGRGGDMDSFTRLCD